MGALAAMGVVLCARLAGDRTRPVWMSAAAAAAAVPLVGRPVPDLLARRRSRRWPPGCSCSRPLSPTPRAAAGDRRGRRRRGHREHRRRRALPARPGARGRPGLPRARGRSLMLAAARSCCRRRRRSRSDSCAAGRPTVAPRAARWPLPRRRLVLGRGARRARRRERARRRGHGAARDRGPRTARRHRVPAAVGREQPLRVLEGRAGRVRGDHPVAGVGAGGFRVEWRRDRHDRRSRGGRPLALRRDRRRARASSAWRCSPPWPGGRRLGAAAALRRRPAAVGGLGRRHGGASPCTPASTGTGRCRPCPWSACCWPAPLIAAGDAE